MSELKPLVIRHRVNTLEELISTPTRFGVEIDLREHNGDIVLCHDPYSPGQNFKDWLKNYSHRLVILNVKEDGLENFIMDQIAQHPSKVEYFFLDQPFPTLRNSSSKGFRTSVRLSEFEKPTRPSLELCNVIWADSFMGDWGLVSKNLNEIVSYDSNKDICFVSPEIHGRDMHVEQDSILNIIFNLNPLTNILICSKFPELWENLVATS